MPTKTLPFYIKIIILTVKILSYLLGTFILGGLIGEGIVRLIPNFDRADLLVGRITNWRSVVFLYIGMTIGAILMTYIFRIGIDKQPLHTLGINPKNIGKKLAIGAAWAVGIHSVTFAILYLSGAVSASVQSFKIVDFLGFSLFFLLVAIQEELIVRGYITSLLMQTLHFIPTLIIASLIFAALHIANVDFTWIGFWSIFLGGYLLSFLFVKNQDLYAPIGMHWFWNFYHGNILGFDVSGIDVPALLQVKMNGPDWLTGGEFGLEGSVVTVALLAIISVYLTVQYFKGTTEVQGPA